MSAHRVWVFALLTAVALCVDLAGLDCRRLTPLPAAPGHVCSCQDPGPSGAPAGPDCLCCSTLDLASLAPITARAAEGGELVAALVAGLADGDPGRLYRPPLA